MKRRGFLASILAAGFAPAAVGSGVLMPVRKIIVPHDSASTYLVVWDQAGLAALLAKDMERAALWANPPVVVDRVQGLIPLLVQNNELLADPVWGRLR